MSDMYNNAVTMRYVRTLLFLTLTWLATAAGPAFSQTPAQEAACANAQTTLAMRQCENERFKRADEKMNAAYRKLNAKLDKQGKEKLRAAQQAWLKFRDADADFQADSARGGSLAPLIATSARADSTEARWKDLEKAANENK